MLQNNSQTNRRLPRTKNPFNNFILYLVSFKKTCFCTKSPIAFYFFCCSVKSQTFQNELSPLAKNQLLSYPEQHTLPLALSLCLLPQTNESRSLPKLRLRLCRCLSASSTLSLSSSYTPVCVWLSAGMR